MNNKLYVMIERWQAIDKDSADILVRITDAINTGMSELRQIQLMVDEVHTAREKNMQLEIARLKRALNTRQTNKK
ncbi:hypothetical protein [Klebsiella aerogenes]|uniref:hypothetical protein n=1 Tax=Klebsiella aerogenes TaxID=548 RepID=UPI0024474ECC|nr:hypothetical protein [Klebsiella aerogenes]MDH1612391.1 hypothetical protein [Klebsiella aerogenes]HAV1831842.1 hypothetical protein [Enterobacter hormaechei subsp. steigerwaltii]